MKDWLLTHPMRACVVVLLALALAACGGAAPSSPEPPEPAQTQSPLPTPLDQIDVREGIRTSIETDIAWLGPGRVTVELEDLDDFGPTILVSVERLKAGRTDEYWGALGSAISLYAEDLERLGYHYAGWQIFPFGRALAKTADWQALGESEITASEMTDLIIEDCC